MKQLTDADIAQMIGENFAPDDIATRRVVRSELHLSSRIPRVAPVPEHTVLDLHQKTVEMAWGEIMELATSGTRTATIITGASGVLKQLFQKWVRDSLLTPYIISATPINNGSFAVKFKKLEKLSSQ